MTGYAFHPEARFDLDEIWAYIRADNIDAADRVVAEILSAIRALVPFPNQGHKRPDLTSALRSGTRISDCLCAGRKTLVDCRRDAWTPKPPYHGRDLKRQRIVRCAEGPHPHPLGVLTAALTAETQPVSLISEADGQEQHAQAEKTQYTVALALLADAIQEHHPDTEGE